MFCHKLFFRTRRVCITAIPQLLFYSVISAQVSVPSGSDVPRVEPMNVPLAITWLTFKAEASGPLVDLNWSIGTDGLPGSFSIERSTDGQTWSVIGSVPTIPGKLAQLYAYQDSLPLNGVSYYRLEHMAAGDTPQVSVVEPVTVTQSMWYLVHPNPVRGQVHLSLLAPKNHHLSLLLLTPEGTALKREEWSLTSAEQSVDMDISGVPTGLYFLDIVDERGSHPQKIAIL